MSHRLMVVASALPAHAQRRCAQLPVDEDPVEQRVDQVRDDDGDDHGPKLVKRLHRAAQHTEGEERQHARHQPPVVGRGERNDVGGLAEQRQQRSREQVIERDGNREDERQQQGPLKGPDDGRPVARTHRLIDERVECRGARPARRRCR